MHVSSSVNLKESCLKLRYVYIMECLSQGKSFKVAVCVYIIKCSSQGKLLKVAVSIYHQVFISGKVV